MSPLEAMGLRTGEVWVSESVRSASALDSAWASSA
jgi:hypothetical protein